MHLVFLLHIGDLFADHVDLGDIVIAQPQLAAVVQVARPCRIDAHAFHPYPIGRNVVRGSDRNARRHGRAGTRAVAFHAFVAVQQRHAPIGPHFLRGQQHVVVGLPDAGVVLALVIPSRGFLRRLMQRSAQHHILHGERRDHGVVRLQHARADDVGVRIQQARRQPYRLKVQIVIDQRDHLILGFGIQIYQRDIARGAVGGKFGVAEVLEALSWYRRRTIRRCSPAACTWAAGSPECPRWCRHGWPPTGSWSRRC